MQQVSFSGRLTYQDFKSANWLAAGNKVTISGLLVLAMSILMWATAGWAIAAMLVGLTSVSYAFQQYPLRKRWQNSRVLQRPVSGTVSDQAITWNVSATSTAQVEWSHLRRWRRSPSLILLYQGPSQVLYFPRHFFTDKGDWTTCGALVDAKLGRK